MKQKLLTSILATSMITLSMVLTSQVLANDSPLQQGLTNLGETETGLRTDGNIVSYIGTVINWLLGLIGTVFFVLVLINGYTYMSAGSNSSKTSEAVSGIVNAVVGLIIVFGAFLITEFAISIVLSE
jgi:hypothetical protein